MIQVSKSAMTAVGNLGFLGGISRPSRCSSAWTIRLSLALPGTTAGPVSPPWSIADRESSLRFPRTCFAPAEWHR